MGDSSVSAWGGPGKPSPGGRRSRPASFRASSKEVQNVAKTLEAINTKVREFEGAAGKLGSASDTKSFRKLLKALRSEVKELCARANEQIKMAQATGGNSAVVGKLKRDYANVMGRFTTLNDDTLIKERRIVARLSAEFKSSSSTAGTARGEENQLQGLQALQMEEDVDTQILRERQAELAAVESEANEIRVLFNEVNEMVGEQGEMLDQVEGDVENTGGKVSQGVTHLGDAYKYLQSYRRKKCFCIGLIIVFIVAIVLILVYK